MMNAQETYQMTHKGEKHIYSENNVIYFGKYNFDMSVLDYKEVNAINKEGFPKEQVLAASIVATEFNENEYVKASGKHEFQDTEHGSRYFISKLANKAIVEGILHMYPHLIEDKHIQAARNILKELEVDFMFKIMSDNMSEFEGSIASVLASDKIGKQYYGVCAYLPQYAVKKALEKTITDKSEASQHLTTTRPDGKIFLNIEVLRSNPSQMYPGYNVSAITDKNHRVSFFTSKEEFRNAQGKTFKIVSKIKSHGTVWKQDHINETRLNYVKII